MPALVTRNFRVHNAKQFKESIDETSGWGGSTVTGTPEGSTSLDDHCTLEKHHHGVMIIIQIHLLIHNKKIRMNHGTP